MTIYGRSEELVSRCVECDLAEPESLTSLGGSAPGVVDGIRSHKSTQYILKTDFFSSPPSTYLQTKNYLALYLLCSPRDNPAQNYYKPLPFFGIA